MQLTPIHERITALEGRRGQLLYAKHDLEIKIEAVSSRRKQAAYEEATKHG